MNIELIIIIIILVIIFTSTQENYNPVVKQQLLNNNNFDTYVINMKKNKDRLINFNNYYNKSDISFKKINVFSAVVGTQLNIVDYITPLAYKQLLELEKTKKRKYHYELSRGGVGCYLSHISIYKKIVKSNADYGIIFEDDCRIANDFYKRLQHGLTIIPNDWDIFLLGFTCINCDINKEYVNINRFWGTQGYIIKKKSVAKILPYLDNLLSKQIDADLSLLVKNKIIKIYGINPMIVIQDQTFKSDIYTKIDMTKESFKEEFTPTS